MTDIDRNPHTTVLLDEAVAALQLGSGSIAVDCTVGAGGHTERLLEAVGEEGLVIGLDRDDAALNLAKARLNPSLDKNLKLFKSAFSQIDLVLKEANVIGQVSGILADIGVSSMHLDDPERGFSFSSESSLDMRMDKNQKFSAFHLINETPLDELTRIIFEYGEEPRARQVAKAIVKQREIAPIETTTQLANLVKNSLFYKTPSRKHPATRVFQAIRIAVNDELGELERMLKSAFSALKPGGRLAIISFHSLEDRIVKQYFIELTGRKRRANVPRDLPIMEHELQKFEGASGEIVKPFPLAPSEQEIERNPRSRSAKLRVITKIANITT